jgi:hypothetical protein
MAKTETVQETEVVNNDIDQVQEKTVVTETTTTETLQPVQKSGRKKTALLIVGGCALLLLLVCGGFFGVTYYLTQQQMKGLTKVESSTLTFFHPENYVKSENSPVDFYYLSPDKNKFEGNSSIMTMDKESLQDAEKITNLDTCKKFANGTLTGEAADPKAPTPEDAVFTELVGVKSCAFKVSYNAEDFGNKSGTIILRAKILVKGDNKAAAVASYDDETKAEEKDRLDRAVGLFNFK